MTPENFISDNKRGWLELCTSFTRFTIKPTWTRLVGLSRCRANPG